MEMEVRVAAGYNFMGGAGLRIGYGWKLGAMGKVQKA